MSADVDVEIESADAESVQSQTNGSPSTEPLSGELSDPLAEGGAESAGDAVQMILPPKPGQGPRVADPVSSVDDLVAQLDHSDSNILT